MVKVLGRAQLPACLLVLGPLEQDEVICSGLSHGMSEKMELIKRMAFTWLSALKGGCLHGFQH